MRHHLFSALLCVAPLLISAQAETEPNQGLSDATANPAWSPGIVHTGSIAMNPPPIDYFDFFRIVLPEDATVTMSVEASAPAAANVVMTIFDANGTVLSSMGGGFSAGITPVTTAIDWDCLQAGTYYFQLTPNQGTDISYALTWTWAGALFGNDQEPNSDADEALTNGLLQEGNWREGHHSYNISDALTDHVDVHALQITEDGGLSVTVIASHLYGPGASLQVLLVDSFGTQMTGMYAAVGATGGSDTTSMESLCLKDGHYFLVIYGINTCGASYRLRYDHVPAPWGDDADVPTALTPGLWTEGHLSFNGNGSEPGSDLFLIEIPEHHVLRVELIGADMQGGNATTDLRLIDSLGATVTTWFGESGPIAGPDTNLHVQGCLPAGTYTLWLLHINGCGLSYRLRCLVEPPVFGSDPEPNNSIATALQAMPDTSNHGFMRDGDQDHWLFFKQYSGPLAMDLRASTQTQTPGSIFWAVLDQDGTLLDQVSMLTGIDNATGPYTPTIFNVTAQDTLILRTTYMNAACLSYDFRYAGGIVGFGAEQAPPTGIEVRPVKGSESRFLVTASAVITTVLVIDLQGAMVGQVHGSERQAAVDLDGYPPGVYTLRVHCRDGRTQAVRVMHGH